MYNRRVAFVAGLAAAIATPLGAQTFSPDRVRADMSYLADDLLEGREAGRRGYDLAARFVATRFMGLGLKPGATDGWYQQVPLMSFAIDPARAASLTIGGRSFDHGNAVILNPAASADMTKGEAEAVFVGYGIADSLLGIDDYRGLDVRGKIAVVIDGWPDGPPSDVAAHLSSMKDQAARTRGAIGVVRLYSPRTASRISWDRMKTNARKPATYWTDGGKPFLDNRAPRIATFHDQATSALFEGAPQSWEAIRAAIADPKVRPGGFALKQRIGFDRPTKSESLRAPNVVAVIPGSDPSLANEVVMLTAHLDHDGIVPAVNGDTIMNGAMDNASGVSTMLEAARAFSETAPPRRTVMLVALAAEEKGLLGADYLARHPLLSASQRLVATVNLDMPILTYDFKDVVAFGAEHSTLGAAVAKAVAAAGVTLAPDPLPHEGLFVRSDHYAFVKQGVPSVFLATGPGGAGAAAQKDFLANHYHRVSDQVSLPIDWRAAARFAQVNYLIARELADAPTTPAWKPDSYFGRSFGKAAVPATR